MRRFAAGLLTVAVVAAGCSSHATSTASRPVAPTSYYPTPVDRGYDVTHYDIRLSYAARTGAIRGTTTVTASSTRRLTRFTLDLHGLRVTRVSVRRPGSPAAPARTTRAGDQLGITPSQAIPRGDRFVTDVAYHGVPRSLDDPSEPGAGRLGWQRLDNGDVFVISEPVGARTWFPANDQPADKATFAVAVDAPPGDVVASNGRLTDAPTPDRGGPWTWIMDRPMAPYLATVVIAPMREQRSVSPGGVPIRNYLPVASFDADARDFARTGEMVDYFSSIISPYPFGEYGVAVVRDDFGYALENQTMSVFGRDMLGTDREAQLTAAHELAHQWFGDSVGIVRWSDIWLNEAFANYLQYVWLAHADTTFDIDRAMADLRADKIDELGPILDPGPEHTFDAAIYERGALAVHALRRTIGDPAFFELLHRWTTEHRYGVATTAEFIRLAEQVSGRDLTAFFHAWLQAKSVPPLPR